MRPEHIQIKNPDVLRGLMTQNYHPILIDIIVWVAQEYGFVMTESHRAQRNANDLHGTDPVRANDLRSWCYAPGEAIEIAREINKKWQYDPRRRHKKTAIIHDSGLGIHFHIQVHPRTILKKNQNES